MRNDRQKHKDSGRNSQPFWTVRISRTSSWYSMETWRTTALFFCFISAARKGHFEATFWPWGGMGWPAGSFDSSTCLGAARGKDFQFIYSVPTWFFIWSLVSSSPSTLLEPVCWWEEEEQRARAMEGAMGLAASSIIMGHRCAYVTRDFFVCWKKAWGTLAKNGHLRTITSMVNGSVNC